MKNAEKQFLVDLGRRIAHCRTSKNISQEKLAEMADISDVYLSYIECGKKNPSAEILFKIAEALQVSLDVLLLPNVPRSKNELDADLCRMVRIYTPKQKEKLVAIIQNITALVDIIKQDN
ncbi:MAG: helix-turn-helix transcriptional regulator [Oscillospiraceae bacterium]|nr:helix-turn-helix transcriptional regulator [Clostridia bacterium]MBQ5318740.1 helix-turn-helix transcriptional regulator [Oscillospiraceae bacterium]